MRTDTTTYEGFLSPNGAGPVFVNGDMPLDPRYDLRNHSPDGFSWGYSGSGPSQLALAILADFLEDQAEAQRLYLQFRDAMVATLPQDQGWRITGSAIREWVEALA